MAEKLYYSMGEVSEMFDVNPSLLRYWGTQFEKLRPHRNAKGNRMYTQADIALLKQIYHFVKERGMTLRGAKLALRAASTAEQKCDNASRSDDMRLYESLQMLRTMLCEVREMLGDEGVLIDDGATIAAEPAAQAAADSAPQAAAEPAEPAKDVAAEPAAKSEKSEKSEPKEKKEQRKPLFVEQTLFG